MPRPKGSRNKPAPAIDEQIESITAEVAALEAQLKDKKAELQRLNEAREAEKQKELLAAISASGKSIDEVIAMINGSNHGAE